MPTQYQQWYQGALTIQPSYIALYDVWQGPTSNSQKLPVDNKRTNSISNKSAQRIRRTIGILMDASKLKSVYNEKTKSYYRFRLNLITLTLPSEQLHTDKEIHNTIFKAFIRAVKQKYHSFLYIYKAEVQDNGNLHYHLTTNTYFPHELLRRMWNYYCNKLGYIDRCSVSNPNSTDVHSVKNIKDLAAYMVSYLTKKDIYCKPLKRWHRRYKVRLKSTPSLSVVLPKKYFNYIKRVVTIKLWDCSKSLQLPPLRLLEGQKEYIAISNYVMKSDLPKIICDRCMIVKIDRQSINGCAELNSLYINWIAKVAG